MSIPGSASPLFLAATGAAGYDIERSLRFNSVDSATLTRTFSSGGNLKTWSWNCWFKRQKLDFNSSLLAAYSSGSVNSYVRFTSSNFLDIYFRDGAGSQVILTTDQVFRDTSSWYALTMIADTTQSTASDRFKVYINGSQITSFSSSTYPALNADLSGFNGAFLHSIGDLAQSTQYFDGYTADVNFVDGQALAPTDFGKLDSNNVWQPKEYAGTYGTTGFHLDFSDNSSVAALGTDTSPNTNTFTVNNLSVTAGLDNDSLRDSPVNGDPTDDTGVGGEISSNYATLSAVHNSGTNVRLGEGGLEFFSYDGNYQGVVATIAMTHKTYWETKVPGALTYFVPGIIRIDTQPVQSGSARLGVSATEYPNSASIWPDAQAVYYNGSSVYSTGAIWSAGDVIGHAYDPATGNYYGWRNGVALNSGNAVATLDTSYTYAPAIVTAQSSLTYAATINFGQRPFAYGNAGTNRADASYKCLCTSNLPDPTIADGSTAMNIATWRGNATARDINVGHRTGLAWIKFRSGAFGTLSHYLYDSNRGTNKSVSSDNTTVEVGSYTNQLTSFNSNGFSLGVDTGGAVNYSGGAGTNIDYVGWSWAGGSSTVANTDGTISSQVSANPSAGFSIVTYTGNATSGSTVGHGLSAEPELIICKNRSTAVNWVVYFKTLGATKVSFLNLADASQTNTNWANTTPTASVFSIGANSNENGSGNNQLAYCFAPVEGYSAFGSYTGNYGGTGSETPPFAYTGFRPRFVLIKNTAQAASWFIFDAKRDTYNATENYLTPDYNGAEAQFPALDILSNGFKIRTNDASFNANNAKIIYAAFAEHPFKTARAR